MSWEPALLLAGELLHLPPCAAGVGAGNRML
jgi:hypothetical protein